MTDELGGRAPTDAVHVDIVSVPPDWEILYVDGTVEQSHHSVSTRDLLQTLEGQKVASWSAHTVEIDVAEVDESLEADVWEQITEDDDG